MLYVRDTKSFVRGILPDYDILSRRYEILCHAYEIMSYVRDSVIKSYVMRMR